MQPRCDCDQIANLIDELGCKLARRHRSCGLCHCDIPARPGRDAQDDPEEGPEGSDSSGPQFILPISRPTPTAIATAPQGFLRMRDSRSDSIDAILSWAIAADSEML